MYFQRSFYFLFALMIFRGKLYAQKGDATGTGNFITIKAGDNKSYRAYTAGPADSKSAIIFIHDYFGISAAAKESVEKLCAMGYLTIGVDLYNGKSANVNDSAVVLMQAVVKEESKRILQAAIDYLKMPGRKLASVAFSAGCTDAMNVNLMAPDLFGATIMVYGGGYDKIEKEKLEKLCSPVLAITGSLDDWPMQAATNFLSAYKNKLFSLYVYAGADHGYAQPLFNGGKNYNYEATRVTWLLIENFLSRNLKLK